ncbi:MAG: hypothetical protein RR032_04170 [Oscillospiraceae bacterium]
MGILHHTFGDENDSAEATVVRLSDRIAYINHDADDAIRAGILTNADLPKIVLEQIGDRHSSRINAIITDLINNSGDGKIQMSPNMTEACDSFYSFLNQAVYKNPKAKGEESKVANILHDLWNHYVKNPNNLPSDYKRIAEEEGVERAVCDYVSGMTDDFAMSKYSQIFIPAAWQVK